MADQESQPSRAPSRAEQRMAAVAKIRRATSLPRMKNGRRLRPMHVEAVSEGEKQPTDEEKVESEQEKQKYTEGQTENPQSDEVKDVAEEHQGPSEAGSDQPLVLSAEKTADLELDAENPDTELEERPISNPTAIKKRRRSRSRSRGSKDLKGKLKPPPSPMPQLAGDSSQDETSVVPSPMLLPMLSPLASPVPHFAFLQPRILRSPTPLPPEMTLFYPGPSPPTPLPTLEDLQRGLIRSNSVGTAAAGRRLAMHKLTGGTETYDPSPSPSPTPPSISKLGRNNTVSGGERIAARQNMLNRLGTRVTREADAEAASGAEEKNITNQRSKRRNKRKSNGNAPATINAATPVSDSDFPSTDGNTPAVTSSSLPELQDQYVELRMRSTTPNQVLNSRTQSREQVLDSSSPSLPQVSRLPKEEIERPEQPRRRSVVIEDPDDDVQNDAPSFLQQHHSTVPSTPQRTFQDIDVMRTLSSHSNGSSSDSAPASAVGVPVIFSQRATFRNESFPTSPFPTPVKARPLSDYEEEQVIYPATTARPRTPYANIPHFDDREISWIASPG